MMGPHGCGCDKQAWRIYSVYCQHVLLFILCLLATCIDCAVLRVYAGIGWCRRRLTLAVPRSCVGAGGGNGLATRLLLLSVWLHHMSRNTLLSHVSLVMEDGFHNGWSTLRTKRRGWVAVATFFKCQIKRILVDLAQHDYHKQLGGYLYPVPPICKPCLRMRLPAVLCMNSERQDGWKWAILFPNTMQRRTHCGER